MRPILAASIVALAFATPGYAQSTAPSSPAPATTMSPAPMAPATTVGQVARDAAAAAGNAARAVSAKAEELTDGWNLRSSVMDQSVYDDKNVRIGEIDDIILTGDAAKGYHVYAVVGVGGFLGIGERKVAPPLSSLSKVDGKFVMHGATKEELTKWPEYKAPAVAARTMTTTTTTMPAPAPATTAPAPAPKQ